VRQIEIDRLMELRRLGKVASHGHLAGLTSYRYHRIDTNKVRFTHHRPLLADMPPARRKARRKALSLVELLIVVAIIAIVFTMVVVTAVKIWKIILKWKGV
jgi:prepilin-type N-terminal cleavage/methylation domain-containing protein